MPAKVMQLTFSVRIYTVMFVGVVVLAAERREVKRVGTRKKLDETTQWGAAAVQKPINPAGYLQRL